MPRKPSDVVVTGIGVVSAIGIGVDQFWESLREGKSGIRCLDARDDDGPKPPSDWRKSPHAGSWVGAPIVGFDAAQFVRPRKALKVMGRELQTAFAASQMAIEQSGIAQSLETGAIAREQVATIFGSQMLYGPASELLDAVRQSMNENRVADITKFGDSAMRQIMPLWMLKYLPNMAACHVGISIGALGPNNTIVSGDTSATAAMMESICTLERHGATSVVCGATGSRIDETYLVYRGDAPMPTVAEPLAETSLPHSKNATGVVFGEAATAIIVESRTDADARSAKPLATVAGYASRFVAPANGSRGSAKAIRLAIESAIESAGLGADEIGLVISHAMGDPSRDEAEREALTQTLSGAPVCTPAALLGHAGAASGGLHMIAAVLSLHHGTIPATPKHLLDSSALNVRLEPTPRPLAKPAVIVLTHNSQGNANAIVFRGEAQ